MSECNQKATPYPVQGGYRKTAKVVGGGGTARDAGYLLISDADGGLLLLSDNDETGALKL